MNGADVQVAVPKQWRDDFVAAVDEAAAAEGERVEVTDIDVAASSDLQFDPLIIAGAIWLGKVAGTAAVGWLVGRGLTTMFEKHRGETFDKPLTVRVMRANGDVLEVVVSDGPSLDAAIKQLNQPASK